jgi:hypothetical protein
MKITFGLIVLAALMAGCASDANTSMRKDSRGNYASTSDYNSMQRGDFAAAMQDGLVDFDVRLASLKTQAEALGPDAVEEYHGCLDGLMEDRRLFVAEVNRHHSMLDADWRDHREDVAEMYVELRESLDEAYEEVLEAA